MNAPCELILAPSSSTGKTSVDWREIPVFIFVKNELEASRDLVTWLLDAGTRRIVLLDCGSDLPSLLDWYSKLPDGASVLRLEAHASPSTFWEQSVHLDLQTPFLVTESGYVPDENCPRDLIATLHSVLERYPDCGKVSASVAVDGITDEHLDGEAIRRWESQFWLKPVDDDLFAAATESGFSLYPSRGEQRTSPANLRIAGAYQVRYRPWYDTPDVIAANQRDTRGQQNLQAPASYSWGPVALRRRIRRSAAVLAYDYRPKVLGFRGDRQSVPGWLNAGHSSHGVQISLGSDASTVLRNALAPDSLDGIHWPQGEGVPEPTASLLTVLYGAAKSDARLWLRVALNDLEGTLAVFAGIPTTGEASDRKYDWRIESCGLLVGPESVSGMADGNQVVVVLRACKPGRTDVEIRAEPPVKPVLHRDRRCFDGFTCV